MDVVEIQPTKSTLLLCGSLLFAALFIACDSAAPKQLSAPASAAVGPLVAGDYEGVNIVIVSIDTLRADHLGLDGYRRDTSPHLDILAKDAITFERARAPRGLTWPSLVSMFTSLYPRSSNVRRNGDLLADDVPTLASLLQERGYETAAFLGNACGVFTRNFDTSYCGTDEAVQRNALKWIDKPKNGPFLLWVHYKAPHEEYLPPAKFDRFTDPGYAGKATGKRDYLDRVTLSQKAPTEEDLAHVVGLYDGEVLYSDALMHQVTEALKKRDLLDSSIFVFTSDHGEELLQHNNYYYHSCSVYEAVHHIPLVIRLPDRKRSGQRVHGIVENIDIAPTLLELIGETPPDGFEGQTLRPLINEDEGVEARFNSAIAEYHRHDTGWIGTIRTDRWHYIYNPDGVTPVCRPQSDYFKVRQEELYDHSKDPLEQLNVAIEHQELVARLRAQLLDEVSRQRDHQPAERADPRVIEQLKAMGYLVE
jgi:arylsulfatase A-like enzyme